MKLPFTLILFNIALISYAYLKPLDKNNPIAVPMAIEDEKRTVWEAAGVAVATVAGGAGLYAYKKLDKQLRQCKADLLEARAARCDEKVHATTTLSSPSAVEDIERKQKSNEIIHDLLQRIVVFETENAQQKDTIDNLIWRLKDLEEENLALKQ